MWKVPGTDVTAARLSTGGERLGEYLGVLDQAGKRATVYRVTADGPERLAAPVALPKGVVGDVIALDGSMLYLSLIHI